MAVQLPPIPNDPIGENHSWREWFLRVRAIISNPSATIFHNLLGGLQGGNATQRQHLTTAQLTDLTTGINADTEHSHAHNSTTGIQGGAANDRQHLTTTQLGYVAGIKPAVYSYQTPATGFNITIPSTVDNLVLNPAGTLATGTIVMPATPIDGQRVVVSTSQIITALTVSPNAGQTLLNAPTTLQLWANTAGAISGYGFSYIYILSITTWVRLT